MTGRGRTSPGTRSGRIVVGTSARRRRPGRAGPRGARRHAGWRGRVEIDRRVGHGPAKLQFPSHRSRFLLRRPFPSGRDLGLDGTFLSTGSDLADVGRWSLSTQARRRPRERGRDRAICCRDARGPRHCYAKLRALAGGLRPARATAATSSRAAATTATSSRGTRAAPRRRRRHRRSGHGDPGPAGTAARTAATPPRSGRRPRRAGPAGPRRPGSPRRRAAPLCKFGAHVAAVKAIAWSPHKRAPSRRGGHRGPDAQILGREDWPPRRGLPGLRPRLVQVRQRARLDRLLPQPGASGSCELRRLRPLPPRPLPALPDNQTIAGRRRQDPPLLVCFRAPYAGIAQLAAPVPERRR